MDALLRYSQLSNHTMMANRFEIQTLGSKTLSQPCRSFDVNEITGSDPTFFHEMHSFMETLGGVGLAAPQIGDDRRYFIIHKNYAIDGHWIFINPLIIMRSDDECPFTEGCLSIPGLGVNVLRPSTIWVKAQDVHGHEFELNEVSGFAARIIQHEFDHVNGTLMIDRLDDMQKMMIAGKLKRIKRAIKQNKG